MTGDPKHLARSEKNPGVLCRTADHGKDKKGRPRKIFKDVLLEVCKKRDDILGDPVMVRLQGAPSDLHAADARYYFIFSQTQAFICYEILPPYDTHCKLHA